jgi:hypothetical protein
MLHWNELKRSQVPPRVAIGYVAGLAAASLAFWLVPAIGLTVADFVAQTAAVDNSPTSPVVWLLVIVMSVFTSLMIVFPVALLFTFTPFFLTYLTSLVFEIRNVLYFVWSGTVTGCLITTLFWGTRAGRDSWVPGQWAAMSACGAIGGFVYWWVAVHRGRDKPRVSPIENAPQPR